MSGKNIDTLIPQRPPFIMVDELLGADDYGGATKYEVKPDNIFIERGELTEPALIENIAQSAAARIGYLCNERNEPVPVGFIAAVQNLQVKDLPKIGQVLETQITIKNQVFDFTVISGTIKCNGMTLAQCDMKIFIQSTNEP